MLSGMERVRRWDDLDLAFSRALKWAAMTSGIVMRGRWFVAVNYFQAKV